MFLLYIAFIFAGLSIGVAVVYFYILVKYPWPKLPDLVSKITNLEITKNYLVSEKIEFSDIKSTRNNELFCFQIKDEHGIWSVEVEFLHDSIVGYGYRLKSSSSFLLNRGGSFQTKGAKYYMREVSR